MRSLPVTGTTIMLLVLLSGCSGPDQPEIANPASVFCEEHDGTVEIRADSDGSQTGYCVFDDGTECEEWAYYRGECEPGAD
ncbi:MAG: DUF333 domain-containing protein [Acidimicrobiia bacterium]|nr:DUF333 domain-containing protein [Acidimicrobiia bacterium]MDH4308967.1 DUF333 domain-containing protein [Acidimicrobiia bacterium]